MLAYALNHERQVVQLLLRFGADVDAQDDSHNTPLHHAAAVGDAELVRTLLERGALMDVAGEDGDSALHIAAYYGHVAVFKMLLDGGADEAALNDAGLTAREYGVIG